ncbi:MULTISPECIES: carboxypeptidase regulatory-like domain-containing protein [unclassified Capnocytophaga]|uniref:carboxypeptidase regulatory-like domain-containing protein n=1 Tax=unclassified Capnocytophaga TaxID=2640652 RepID=UPI0002DDC44B|nr:MULTISPECIES: carboxypeptidase regulatory-like domain-containing protein [unclassified Capnocytophaga]MEB3003933.1 carboxypeptidase regulatory-like domain-containing protein [Capnocytophaga sp. G2]
MTRITIFLFFFTLSTMAQIIVSGRVFDEKKKPFPTAIVSNGREKVYTDAQGNYTIQAKLFDILYFDGETKLKGRKIKYEEYCVVENTPHQEFNTTLYSILWHKCERETICTYGISFYLNDKKITTDKEAFKEHVRNGEFYTYEIRTCNELPETIEKLSRYTVLVYTEDYYNQHIKDKQK